MDCQSEWVCLPDVVLLIVYELLPNRDRFSVSVVCKNWNRLFGTARLWRVCELAVDGRGSESAEGKRNRFAERFGSCVRRLTITFCQKLTCEYFHRIFAGFVLQLFRSAKLVEFRLMGVESDRRWGDSYSQHSAICILCDLFRKQKSLRSSNLDSPLTSGDDHCATAVRLVRQSPGCSAEVLFMHNFEQTASVCRRMYPFPQLRFFSTNFRSLPEIIRKWQTELARYFRHFKFKIYGRTEPYRGATVLITVCDSLPTACPGLKLVVVFENDHLNDTAPVSISQSSLDISPVLDNAVSCIYLKAAHGNETDQCPALCRS